MSNYEELKRQRDRALVESIHGPLDGAEPAGFDGGARIDYYAQRPSSAIELAQRGVLVSPRQGDGWGPEYEIEDGASLLFPHLELGED